MNVVKNIKTNHWDMDELEIVLKQLKSKKSRDPYCLANEIFKQSGAGD